MQPDMYRKNNLRLKNQIICNIFLVAKCFTIRAYQLKPEPKYTRSRIIKKWS